MPISFWTLLRLLRGTLPAHCDTPHVLGTDDFAWRKGDHYGTILVDLQAHLPVDLPPDREAETFAAWLREHSGVEVVSRDRASAYAEGAKQGAPDAIQVADRYHLVANLRDTLQRLLDRERHCLPPLHESESAASPEPTGMASMEQEEQREDAHPEAAERVSITRAQALRRVRRSKRYERYHAVVELHQQGLGARAIARQTGLSRNTVRRYLEAGTFPEQRLRTKRRSLLDPYLLYLRERWGAGCQNAAQLARELQDRGYRGSPTTLRALISDWRASSPTSARRTSGPRRTVPAPGRRRLSSRQASFLFVKRPEALTPAQQRSLEQICQASDELERVYELSQQFVSMVRQRQAEQLDAWLTHVKAQGLRELIGFASGIKRDYAAV